MSFDDEEIRAFATTRLKAEPSLITGGELDVGNVEFQLCACGVVSTKVPCWDCFQGKENQRAMDRDKAALPARFRDVTDETARVRVPGFKSWEKLLARQRKEPSRSFTFIGSSGAGKTTLACWLATKHQNGCMFVRSAEIERARKESSFQRSQLLVDCETTTKVLIIDELRDIPGTFQATFDIIDARHNSSLPTYVTTGLTLEQLKTAFGDGLVRRLASTACAGVVAVSE